MKPVGYLTNSKAGLEGEAGAFYDYCLAANGLFIRARNDNLQATIQVAPARVRGLEPLEEELLLSHGLIPSHVLEQALRAVQHAFPKEGVAALVWNGPLGTYQVISPEQVQENSSVSYQAVEQAVLEIHSHGQMDAFFSGQDNRDEQGFRLYGVVGRLRSAYYRVGDPPPRLRLRIGVYGYFAPVAIREVATGPFFRDLECATHQPEVWDLVRAGII